MEDEFYLRRLDAGLFSLQLIDCVIMEVCSSGVASVISTVILISSDGTPVSSCLLIG